MKSLFEFVLILTFCLAVSSVDIGAQEKPSETQVVKPVKKANQRPIVEQSKTEPFDKATVETMAVQCVIFETEAGNVEMEMFPESAPESVRSFLNLAAIGALDTTTFSRVVPGFIVQGGDLYTRQQKMTVELGNRARRTLPDEPSQIKHERGILSMARSDEPNSATTNFFILVGSAPHLDGTFSAFGRVVKGMEIVDAINKMPIENEKPKNPVRISKATVAPCPSQEKP